MLIFGLKAIAQRFAIAAIMEAVNSVGLGVTDPDLRDRLVNIFAKAEASPDGCICVFRHTMLDDSDVGSTRHRAVGGCGTGAIYVSGGAEHQGAFGAICACPATSAPY